MRTILLFCAAAAAFADDFNLDKAGPPPQEVAPAIRDALDPDGAKIAGPNGVVCEVWWRKDVPAANNGEDNVSFTDIPHGALLGVIRYPEKAQDRRGQAIAPGVYTMRLSFFPVDGAHQGVSQTRDFVLLTKAADDKDLSATPSYKQLVEMSKKAAGSNHPAILNLWKADSAGPASLKQEGEEWILHGTVGARPVAMIVVGTHTG
jgi:hypothetical protein